jgi:hypothetical protein
MVRIICTLQRYTLMPAFSMLFWVAPLWQSYHNWQSESHTTTSASTSRYHITRIPFVNYLAA